MKTKILTIIALICAALSMNAQTRLSTDFTVNGIGYHRLTTNAQQDTLPVCVSNVSSSLLGTLTIPSTVTYQSQIYKVVSIGDAALYQNQSIFTVILPPTVTKISDYALSKSLISEIHIPEGLKAIGYHAFSGSRIQQIELPNTLVSIGSCAFDSSALKSIEIPKNVSAISTFTFSNCISLRSVTFAEDSKTLEIETRAFDSCLALRTVSLPSSLYKLGTYTFNNCKSLESIEIPKNITVIPEACFSGCSALESVKFPKNLSSIGSQAFNGCSNLSTLSLPENVSVLASEAFTYCKNLKSIFIPRSLQYSKISSSAFTNCPSIADIYIDHHPSTYAIAANIKSDFPSASKIYVPKGMKELYTPNASGLIFEEQEISLNLTAKRSVSVGKSFNMNYTTTPAILPLTNPIVWTSSNPAIATVDQNGNVTGIAVGNVTITATSTYDDDHSLKGICNLTVMPAPESAFIIPDFAGTAEAIIPVEVNLTNKEAITSFQCDITLPAGFEPATEEGSINVTLSNRKRTSHVIDAATQEDGTVRVACFSTRNQTFNGNEGLLFTLNVRSTTAKPETYDIKIDNIIVVDGNGNELSLDPCVGKLTLSPKLASGDVNGDGTVNITDATQVMAYILGNTPANFNVKEADANGDGVVNITDATKIVDIILNTPTSETTASLAPRNTRAEETNTERLMVENFTITAGEEGILPVSLDSPTAYTSFQTDIYLPEGLEVITFDEDGEMIPDVTLNSKRATSSHVISSKIQPNGALRVVCLSTRNALFRTSSDKVLFNVAVRATSKLSPGTNIISFKNTIFNTPTEESKFADSKSYFDFTTGVNDIEAESDTAEYYNLHGQRVLNPSNGIFIKKQGSKTTKVTL